MTIEVRQLLIKSTVRQPENPQATGQGSPASLDELKKNILQECREIIYEVIEEEEER